MSLFKYFQLLFVFTLLSACGSGSGSGSGSQEPPAQNSGDNNPHACLAGTWQAISQTSVNGQTIGVDPVYMVISGLSPHSKNGSGSTWQYTGDGLRIWQLSGGFIQDTYTDSWDVLISSHSDTGASDGLFTIHNACSTVYSGDTPNFSLPSCSSATFTNQSDVLINCNVSPAEMTLTSPIAKVDYVRLNTSTLLQQPSIEKVNDKPNDGDPTDNGSDAAFSTPSDADAGWSEDLINTYNGSSSFATQDIDHYESSQMQYTGTFQAGTLKFHYRVSSEEFYDYLYFSVDGNDLLEVSGEVDWSLFSTTLSAGEHTLLWMYLKDPSTNAGDDQAWIANITLPNGLILNADGSTGNSTDDPGSNDDSDALVIVDETLNLVIEGLDYSTTIDDGSVVASGTTDSLGGYQYVEGYDTKFHLGNLLIQTLSGEADQNFIDIKLFPNVASDIKSMFINNFKSIPLTNTSLQFNRLRLLFTLDSDQDASNGIQLSSQTRTTFSNYSLSINSRPNKFAAHAGEILQLLNLMLLEPSLTLYHVYHYFGLDIFTDKDNTSLHNIPLNKTIDGLIYSPNEGGEGINVKTTDYEYDAFDREIFVSYESDTLGIHTEYNEAGYKTLYYGDGSDSQTWQYNAAGFITIYQAETQNGSLFDRDVYHYDGDGNLTHSEGRYNYGYGMENTNTTYTHDFTTGNLLTRNFYRPEGSYNSTETYQYDLMGRQTYHNRTTTVGINTTATWQYDVDGYITRQKIDKGAKGTISEREFNEDKQLTRLVSTVWLASRIIETETNYYYDNNGVLYESDVDTADTHNASTLDGIPNSITEYHYDSNDNLLYSNVVGMLATATFEYNSDNLVSRLITDSNQDGSANSYTLYEYDANYIKNKEIIDLVADGDPEVITNWSYRTTKMLLNKQ